MWSIGLLRRFPHHTITKGGATALVYFYEKEIQSRCDRLPPLAPGAPPCAPLLDARSCPGLVAVTQTLRWMVAVELLHVGVALARFERAGVCHRVAVTFVPLFEAFAVAWLLLDSVPGLR